MAIYIIQGKVGSGKTYYAVHHLLTKHFSYDEVLMEWIPKKNINIVTNIDGIKIDSIDLKKEIEEKGMTRVFSGEYVEDLRKSSLCNNVIYVIDESQNIFDRKYYDKNVFYFFQYSRHYGVDIYLITQDVETLAKELRSLSEYYIHAVSRSHGTKSVFTYKYMSGYETFKTTYIKKNKNVFMFYRSFNHEETEKIKPIYYKYVGYTLGLVLLSVVVFKFAFANNFMSQEAKREQKGVKNEIKEEGQGLGKGSNEIRVARASSEGNSKQIIEYQYVNGELKLLKGQPYERKEVKKEESGVYVKDNILHVNIKGK